MHRSRSPSPQKGTNTVSSIKRYEDLRTSQSLDDAFLKLYQELGKRLELLGRVPRVRVRAWISKLNELTSNLVWKRNRNRHAWLLLEQLKSGKLGPPFNKMPPEGPLQTLPHWTMYGYTSPTKPRPALDRLNGAQVASSLDEYMYRQDERRRRAAAVSPHMKAAQRAASSPSYTSPTRTTSPVRASSAGRMSPGLLASSPFRVSAQLQSTTLHAQLLEDRLRVAEERIAQQEAELARLRQQQRRDRQRSSTRQQLGEVISKYELRRMAWESPEKAGVPGDGYTFSPGPDDHGGRDWGNEEEAASPMQQETIPAIQSGPPPHDRALVGLQGPVLHGMDPVVEPGRVAGAVAAPASGRPDSMKEALRSFERETARLNARLQSFMPTSKPGLQQLQRSTSGNGVVQEFERFAADTDRLKAKLGIPPTASATFTISGTLIANPDPATHPLQTYQDPGLSGMHASDAAMHPVQAYDTYPSQQAGIFPVAVSAAPAPLGSDAAMAARDSSLPPPSMPSLPMAAGNTTGNTAGNSSGAVHPAGTSGAPAEWGGVLQQFQRETDQLRKRIEALTAASPTAKAAAPSAAQQSSLPQPAGSAPLQRGASKALFRSDPPEELPRSGPSHSTVLGSATVAPLPASQTQPADAPLHSHPPYASSLSQSHASSEHTAAMHAPYSGLVRLPHHTSSGHTLPTHEDWPSQQAGRVDQGGMDPHNVSSTAHHKASQLHRGQDQASRSQSLLAGVAGYPASTADRLDRSAGSSFSQATSQVHAKGPYMSNADAPPRLTPSTSFPNAIRDGDPRGGFDQVYRSASSSFTKPALGARSAGGFADAPDHLRYSGGSSFTSRSAAPAADGGGGWAAGQPAGGTAGSIRRIDDVLASLKRSPERTWSEVRGTTANAAGSALGSYLDAGWCG